MSGFLSGLIIGIAGVVVTGLVIVIALITHDNGKPFDPFEGPRP